MNFKEKVQSMTASEIILAMVDSLTPPPKIKVDMGTYGEVNKVDKRFLGIKYGTKEVCFGCAATNTICQISGKIFDKTNIYLVETRANFLDVDYVFLQIFETAIDKLRRGSICGYNSVASEIDVAEIKECDEIKLPFLDTDYKKEDLEPYRQLAQKQ